MIPLQFLSLNLTSPVHLAEANETQLRVKADINDNATKPTFQFDFGDGTVVGESSLSLARHMYHFTGNYVMKVQAFSLCNSSHLTANNTISVPKPVKILDNVSLISNATVFGETTAFRLIIAQGSDFTCTWSLGDNSNYTIQNSNPGTSDLTHVYSAPATYKVRVACKNRRSEVSTSVLAKVQKLITGLKIFPVPPILFRTQVLVRWQIEDGTDVVYKAHISSNVTLEVVESKNELHAAAWVRPSHYKTHGEFFLDVAASNAVTKWIFARLRCVVLRSVIPFTPKLRHKSRDIEMNETISISFTAVNSLPEINASFSITFGDGSQVVVTRQTFVNHSYEDYGYYTVNITTDNGVSTFNTSIRVQVHKPVLRLQGAIIPNFAARVDDNINVTMFLRIGSDFDCQWDFGDGSNPSSQNLSDNFIYLKGSKDFTNINISANHVYKDIGVFNITTICRNRLSEVKSTCLVTVQEEITLFQVSIVPPVIFGKDFVVNFTIASGTNVTFTAFLNHKELDVENTDMHYFSSITHDMYDKPGQYNLTVTAENLVTSLLRNTQVVFIEMPISGICISMSYSEANVIRPGYGAEKNIFAENTPVVFQAFVENGTNLEYTWSISNVTMNSSWRNQTMIHAFNEAGVYVVSLLVENHISMINVSVSVAIQKPVSFEKDKDEIRPVTCASPKVRNETVAMEVAIKTLGTNSALQIDIDNNTSYWFGDFSSYTAFKKMKTNNSVHYKGKLSKSLILYHVYKIPGIYNIRAVLANDVSRSLQTCQVEILSRPCKNPTVKLKYVGDTPDDATNFFTIDNILIEAVVDIFCPESKESKYAWTIFQENPEKGTFESVSYARLNDEASMQELRIKRRSLSVGLYRLILTIGMVEEELKDFASIAEGFIQVLQSPLIAEIAGGSEIRRGYGPILTIDGINSYDPDIGLGNHSGIGYLITEKVSTG